MSASSTCAYPGPVGTAVRVAGLALYGLMIEIDATVVHPGVRLTSRTAGGVHAACCRRVVARGRVVNV